MVDGWCHVGTKSTTQGCQHAMVSQKSLWALSKACMLCLLWEIKQRVATMMTWVLFTCLFVCCCSLLSASVSDHQGAKFSTVLPGWRGGAAQIGLWNTLAPHVPAVRTQAPRHASAIHVPAWTSGHSPASTHGHSQPVWGHKRRLQGCADHSVASWQETSCVWFVCTSVGWRNHVAERTRSGLASLIKCHTQVVVHQISGAGLDMLPVLYAPELCIA